ncbi:MAG TPA: DUF1634 domain-containing protein [Deltaproteobacteria bacterium]|nr:DUF1634 domain-containing protein [Deltaproteobacteria bacterium]
MDETPELSLKASPEQLLYARILEKGMFIGLICLLVTFAIYTFGIMKPYVSLDRVSCCWAMNVTDYLHQENIKSGWAWLGMLKYGDFINFIGIAILAGVSIFCYLAIVPVLIKNKDRIYVVLALLEAIVLSIAASGLIAVGH